jgi:hypothetical protein
MWKIAQEELKTVYKNDIYDISNVHEWKKYMQF